MATRFNEVTAIRQSNVSTGAAQGLQSLASRLDAFASQQAQVASRNIAAKAVEAQATGQAQFDPTQELGDQQQDVPALFGQEAQAFNKGLRAAYVAGIDRDNREEVSRIAQENPDNLLVFNDAVEAYRKSVLDGVDQTARTVVGDSLDNQITSARIQVQGNTIKREKQEIVDTLNSNAQSAQESSNRLARNGDLRGAALELQNAFATVDEMDISGDEKATIKRDMERGVTEEGMLGQLDTTFDEEGVQAALDQLDDLSDNVPKGFTTDEWDKFITGAQKGISRKVARQAKVAKADLKAIELNNSIERGLLFTNPDIPADPAKSGQDRKDVNNYYDSVAGSWLGLPQQAQVDLNVEFVENTGLIPETLISNTGAAMRSGNVEQVMLMSDVISRIQETSPASLKDIPDETRAISLQVSDAVKAGIDPTVALEQAKSAFSLTDSQRETIRMQSQEASKDLNKSLQSFVNEDVEDGGFDTGIFSNVPDVPAAMLGEYRTTFDRFMQMTNGNAQQSQKLAYQSAQATWGITETGGPKRFMKYAPEVIYNQPGTNNNWIENQFNEEMEDAGHLGAIIAVDHSVAREDQPSYPILIIDEKTGLQKPLLDVNNAPLRWKPEFKATEQYKELVNLPGQEVVKAKKQRKVNLTRRANEIRRGIQSRILSANPLPFNERADFIESEEGKRQIAFNIGAMNRAGKIDDGEANEARKAFGIQ